MKSKSLFLLSFLSTLTLCQAATKPHAAAPSNTKNNTLTQDVDYGDLYMVQKKATKTQSWQTWLDYGYGFSNPYLSVHGTSLAMRRKIGDFFSLGLSGSYYFVSEKEVASNVAARLGAQNISVEISRPKYSTFGFFTISPLSGFINWLNQGVVEFELIFLAGAGSSWYEEQSGALPSFRFAVLPQFMISKTWGVQFGFNTVFDRMSGTEPLQNRMDATLGLVAAF